MKRKIVSIALALGLLIGLMATPAQAATPEEIDEAIQKGLARLADQQDDSDGYFEARAHPGYPPSACEVYVVGSTVSGKSYYIKSNQNGTFGSELYIDSAGPECHGNGIGDFDNDCDYDLIQSRDQDVHYFEKTGAGNTFTYEGIVGTGSGGYLLDYAVEDYNNDGNMDFVNIGFHGGLCHVFLGNGDGTFTESSFSTSAMWSSGKDAADFDNDGNMDFAVACYNVSTVYIYLGNGNGTFTENYMEEYYYDEYYSLTAGDFDNDGNADLILVGLSYGDDPFDPFMDITYGFRYLKGDGAGGFTDQGTILSGDETECALIDNFDFNEDGNMDIMFYSSTWHDGTWHRRAYYYEGNGDGTFTYRTYVSCANLFYAFSAPPWTICLPPPCPEEPGSRTMGFYKNHPCVVEQGLPITIAGEEVTDVERAIEVIKDRGTHWSRLRSQLMVTKLNVAVFGIGPCTLEQLGLEGDETVNEVIAQAEELLADPGATKDQLSAKQDLLDRINNSNTDVPLPEEIAEACPSRR